MNIINALQGTGNDLYIINRINIFILPAMFCAVLNRIKRSVGNGTCTYNYGENEMDSNAPE